MEKENNVNLKEKSKKKKIVLIVLITVLAILILSFTSYILYKKVYLDINKLNIKLNGDKAITLKLDEEYKELGAKASFRNKSLTNNIKVKGSVDTKKVGEYKLTYIVKKENLKKELTRTIKVIDDVNPVITLTGDSKISLTVGDDYKEPGFVANDNYDGNITDKVVVTNNIDKNKKGNYEVVYKVSDTSNNSFEIKREVEYKEKVKSLPNIGSSASRIAVLNYHFFYDENTEKGNQSIFISTRKFEEQLKYLKDNNYKTLTMEEFRAWMYGEINLPARSVLLTVDDGAAGTGFHNGNKLIPLLEKYDVNATLFLITGWWDKSNYVSKNLGLESHTNDMHTEGFCSGVTRGAKMLCLSNEDVLKDLNASVSILNSNRAFAYPFYAYSDNAIELLKQAGFKLAFAGGNVKATRNSNKYKIPRYPIQKGITLQEFINMIS